MWRIYRVVQTGFMGQAQDFLYERKKIMHRNKIQMEMTGLVNMMASVFLRYFFIDTNLFF